MNQKSNAAPMERGLGSAFLFGLALAFGGCSEHAEGKLAGDTDATSLEESDGSLEDEWEALHDSGPDHASVVEDAFAGEAEVEEFGKDLEWADDGDLLSSEDGGFTADLDPSAAQAGIPPQFRRARPIDEIYDEFRNDDERQGCIIEELYLRNFRNGRAVPARLQCTNYHTGNTAWPMTQFYFDEFHYSFFTVFGWNSLGEGPYRRIAGNWYFAKYTILQGARNSRQCTRLFNRITRNTPRYRVPWSQKRSRGCKLIKRWIP